VEGKLARLVGITLYVVMACGGYALAQQQKQDIPDAPSSNLPPQFPTTAPPVGDTPQQQQQPPLPPNEAAPGDPPNGTTPNDAPPTSQPSEPAPPMKITTVPEGGSTADTPPANEQVYKLQRSVNQVIVPFLIKDDDGRMVEGVVPKDVSVYEDGKKQELNFFTSDPFALSAAVVIDTGMPDIAVQKVNKTFTALQAAFSPYDEVAVYTYSTTVGKATSFTAANQKLNETFQDLSSVRGHNNGPPITGGPLGPQGPTINGQSVDPNVPSVITPARESHVLNDAVLAAATDLLKRDKSRRKVIFIITDGREYRSSASYQDVLKVLLSANIMVFGIGVEGSAIPLYNKIERLHLPKFGYSDILPKYANATGGEVYNEYTRNSIEDIYLRVAGDARNQYTLGYASRATPSSAYREVEIRVANHGPSCKTAYRPCADITAKAGYYPLPPSR
jgi:VWFA-related protein